MLRADPAATDLATLLRRALRLALPVLVVLGLLLAARVLVGQQRSCWGSGILAGQCFPLDTSARPWGPSGGHVNDVLSPPDLAALGRRYAGGNNTAGSQPIGPAGEGISVAVFALEGAYAERCTDIPTRPGATAPTAEEVWDLIVQDARCSATYFACYWQHVEGGTADRPVVVTAETWGANAHRLETRPGACDLGSHEVAELCGWARHYRIDWLPEQRPWCDWTPPTVGDRVEVQAHPMWQPGTISRVSGSEVTIRLDAGGTRREQFADEERRWRRVGAVQPTPTPRPTSTPTPMPTPTPEDPACWPAVCPCEDPVAGRWLAERIAAWPRNEDGSLRPGKRPAVAVWRLVRAAEEWLAVSAETCPCERSTGQVELCLEEVP